MDLTSEPSCNVQTTLSEQQYNDIKEFIATLLVSPALRQRCSQLVDERVPQPCHVWNVMADPGSGIWIVNWEVRVPHDDCVDCNALTVNTVTSYTLRLSEFRVIDNQLWARPSYTYSHLRMHITAAREGVVLIPQSLVQCAALAYFTTQNIRFPADLHHLTDPNPVTRYLAVVHNHQTHTFKTMVS